MKVRCINNKRFEEELTKGKIYEAYKDGRYYCITDDIGDEDSKYFQSRFEVVTGTTKTGEENVMEKKREFNFVLPSVCAFSRQEWTSDLSKENPLIVFRVNGYTDFMIHESVVKKSII